MTNGKATEASKARQPSDNLSYVLYLHKQELRRRKARLIQLETKIYLTEYLISKTMKNINAISNEDLEALNREMVFKKQLQARMQRFLKIQQMLMMAQKRAAKKC